MAHSISQAYKRKKSDEYYTPTVLCDAFWPYLENWLYGRKHNPTVWLPFDLENSEWAFLCRKHYVQYVCSHIQEGQDFFTYEPPKWDVAISNPPFSCKLDVFKRLDSFSKPWAMLMNTSALNYHEIIDYFCDNPKELLFFNKRISFDGNPSSFGSMFVCNDFLINDVKFAKLPHNNTGKHYFPSRMLGSVKFGK